MAKKISSYSVYLKAFSLLAILFLSRANASDLDTTISYQKAVKIAVTDIPYSLSPYASERPLDAQYAHLFFDPLVRWGKNKKLEYRLITKIESLKDNKIRFKLKKNIHFHSGNLLTSKDVIWSFNTALNNKYLHRKFQYKIEIIPISNSLFDIQTELTQEQLLDYLSHLFILDSAYYTRNNIKHDVLPSALPPPIEILPLSGTGPYRIASFYPEVNLRVRVSRNYWGNEPRVKSLNFVKVKSMDSRLYALLAGDIDISEEIPSKSLDSIQLLDNKKSYQTSSKNGVFLIINEQKNDFFEKEVTRNSIHQAINQQGIVNHILNGAGSTGETLDITSDSISPIYDAKRSAYLLQKFEMPKSLSLLIMGGEGTQYKEIINALENMFKRVGIKLEITEVESVGEWDKLQAEFDLMLSAWHSPLVDADNLYQDIFSNSLISNYIQLLFEQQGRELTMEEKIRLFHQYQLSDRIVSLFSQNKIWASDKHFKLENIFSVNGIAYWHLLTTTD